MAFRLLAKTLTSRADEKSKGGHTLVTLPRIVTPYRASADGTRDSVNVSKVGYAVKLRACSVCCRYLAVASKG